MDVPPQDLSPRLTARAGRFGLSRPVWLLGWASLFTDMATEMIYPLLPLFLTRMLGASAMSLGVIEGVAEAANSALKVVSGRLADRWRAPKPLVLAGYGLSSAIRPFISVASSWAQVLTLRFIDRLGKGIRGAPRDAMLASFSGASIRGRVFGFHRAMDHTGAIAGPLIASAFLYVRPDDYRTLFALTALPGIVVMAILLRVPAPPRPPRRASAAGTLTSQLPTSKPPTYVLPGSFHRAMFVIFIFSLGNATDAFLLLRLSDLGVAAFWIPLLWAALHVVKAASSLLGGELSDRLGRRHVIALGWTVYAIVYAAFAAVDAPAVVVAVFLFYGLFFGLTEGVEKAWVADLAPPSARGTAFGLYNAVLGIGSLAASLLFGWMWTRVSPPAAFLTGAALAACAIVLLYLISSDGRQSPHPGHQR